MLREALSNVVRHAGATSVHVSADVSGGRLTPRVLDAGWAWSRPRHAAAGMRRRAEALAGTCDIGRAPGSGTLVTWSTSTPLPSGSRASRIAASSRPEAYDVLPQRPFTDRPRAPGRDFDEEPLVAVLGVAGNTAGDQLTAGQAPQRALLTATDAGLAASMVSQPIEVPAAREQLRLALGRSGTPQMVLRVGYGEPGHPSPRRPVADVLDLC